MSPFLENAPDGTEAIVGQLRDLAGGISERWKICSNCLATGRPPCTTCSQARRLFRDVLGKARADNRFGRVAAQEPGRKDEQGPAVVRFAGIWREMTRRGASIRRGTRGLGGEI